MNATEHNEHINNIISQIRFRRSVDAEILTLRINSNDIVVGKFISLENVGTIDQRLNFELDLLIQGNLTKFNVIDILEVIPSDQKNIDLLN